MTPPRGRTNSIWRCQMKKRLLIAFALVAVAATSWAIWAQACDKDKQTTAQASNARMSGCPHHSGATAAEYAIYSSNATAAHAGTSCEGHGGSAATASSNG